ncbi:hypothetical protein HMPREF3185_00668 [Porphyromonas somerae]|uniref:Uncharacterized protein n=1 Tax=Porphyromonas somerae TaxID=322095 RepID=A0A134BAP6_9PORP|nr:hypothetical protein HMPREF3184_00668 [Porphyromonadaceae bacterium KA00676]KXB77012.1 hypothetical protein HMPREF3185_00668 [Porphyromonas somerae]
MSGGISPSLSAYASIIWIRSSGIISAQRGLVSYASTPLSCSTDKGRPFLDTAKSGL